MSSSASSTEGKAAVEFTEVVIVRHGKTSWNASRIIQGHLDAELNDIERKQAVAVAHRLSKEAKPAAIYSSDLKRAAETAQTIARICNLPNVVFDPALRERHTGDLQGMKFQDAATEKPEAYKAFVSHKRNQQIPEERLKQYQTAAKRLDNALLVARQLNINIHPIYFTYRVLNEDLEKALGEHFRLSMRTCSGMPYRVVL